METAGCDRVRERGIEIVRACDRERDHAGADRWALQHAMLEERVAEARHHELLVSHDRVDAREVAGVTRRLEALEGRRRSADEQRALVEERERVLFPRAAATTEC